MHAMFAEIVEEVRADFGVGVSGLVQGFGCGDLGSAWRCVSLQVFVKLLSLVPFSDASSREKRLVCIYLTCELFGVGFCEGAFRREVGA